MTRRFEHHGVIEGYYGPPYTHTDRLWWIGKLGSWGMNLYLYAPKNDALQRQEWRTPYSAEAMREFAELVERGAARGVRVGFSISPGLSMQYSSADDLRALGVKLQSFREIGVRFFVLSLDDVPTHLAHEADRKAFPSLAHAHVAVAHAARNTLGPGDVLALVPTDYVGVASTDYLDVVGETLDPSIEVGWTGRTVVSPEVRSDEAAARAATLRRRVFLWDNVPVSDGPMRTMLHLGPFARRDAGLPEHVSGIVLNVMQHPHASAIAVRTAADYVRDPRGYDPERAWHAALDELGAGASEAFADFAAAHRFSPLHPRDRDPDLEAALEEVRASLRTGRGERAPLATLRVLLERRSGAPDALRAGLLDRRLATEIEPWLESHGAETRRMLAAMDFLDMLVREGPRLPKVLAFFGFAARTHAAASPAATSYGPRRVLYPQLASLRDDEAGFGDDPTLFTDLNLADELVRLVEDTALERLRAPRR